MQNTACSFCLIAWNPDYSEVVMTWPPGFSIIDLCNILVDPKDQDKEASKCLQHDQHLCIIAIKVLHPHKGSVPSNDFSVQTSKQFVFFYPLYEAIMLCKNGSTYLCCAIQDKHHLHFPRFLVFKQIFMMYINYDAFTQTARYLFPFWHASF